MTDEKQIITSDSFQRGVYPAEDFTPVKKYGLNMLGMENKVHCEIWY